MGKILTPFLFFALFLSLGLSGCHKDEDRAPDLTIYAHDSFVGKGGMAEVIQPLFEKKYGCKIRFVSVGDAAQLVSRLQLDTERAKTEAQVVVGLDAFAFERAKPHLETWGSWTPARFDKVPADLKLGSDFLPYDYSLLSFMADLSSIKGKKLASPVRLTDLLSPEWKKSLILEDPRTSTPGLMFLVYTQALLGEKVWKFWASLKWNWLTLAKGWSGAYQLFLKGEAPLVWSYVTSQAYHRAHGDLSNHYAAAVFEEGQPLQVEGAALIKGSVKDPNTRGLAQYFLEFLISAEVQAALPKKNWMFPSVEGTQLPAEFQSLPVVTHRLRLNLDAKSVEELLKRWTQEVSKQ